MTMEGLTPDFIKQKNTSIILQGESFKTHGIGEQEVLEFLETANGKLFKFRLAEADPNVSAAELDRRAIAQLTSGRELPRIETIGIDESLVKIVPYGTSPSAYSPFWTKEAELDAAVNAGKNLSDHFALPIVSEAPRYDVYRITPKVPTDIFVNTVSRSPRWSVSNNLCIDA